MTVMPVGEMEGLNEAEQRVLTAVCDHGTADFTDCPPGANELRGRFIEELIAGTLAGSPQLCGPLRIRGAKILGPIRAVIKSTEGASLTLLFMGCEFDSSVDFSGTELLSLRLVDCVLPAFVGISMATKADLDFSGSRFSGVCSHFADLADVGNFAIQLNHARIGGRLLMSATAGSRFETHGAVYLEGARIDSSVLLHGALFTDISEEAAFNARSAVVGGNVELSCAHGYRCEVYGEVALGAAQITGDLTCGSARIINPEGRSLHCEDLVVESVFLSVGQEGVPFESEGRMNFLSARVGGSFFLVNSRLRPGPDYMGLLGRGGPVVINAQQMRVSNAAVFYNLGTVTKRPEPGRDITLDDPIKPVEGWFMMIGMSMSSLVLHAGTGWPAPGYLEIDGMTYERIRHVDGGDMVTCSKAWLRRQYQDGIPDCGSFRPQPYEQLTRVLRNGGLSREANEIAVEKIRMRLESRVDSRWKRVFPRLLMLISQHGYSTSRAVYTFLLFVLAGAVMYTLAIYQFGQPFYPFEHEPEPTTYILPAGLGTIDAPLGCPGLDTVQYALDFALPVINLGQDTFCRFVPDGPARWLWLTLHSLYGVIGAVLSAVVVLTVTGILRRD
ncbi:MAG: hypothetical protein AAGF57_15400 [Pseudomonadota bacterium]